MSTFVEALKKERESLVQRLKHLDALILMEASDATFKHPSPRKPAARKSPSKRLSKAGKAAISKAAKARWAQYRKQNGTAKRRGRKS